MLRRVITLFLLTIAAPSLANDHVPDQLSNVEMSDIFDADQEARSHPSIDWATVSPQDESRRKRTQALLDAGALKTGDDFFHAAFIFQHGGSSDDYLKAHLLSMTAMAKGNPKAAWIASATLDRYLQSIGKPQVLGTQFRTGPDGRTTQSPFDNLFVSDSVRHALGVPSLSDQEKRRENIELVTPPTHQMSSIPELQNLPFAPAAKSFSDNLKPTKCRSILGADDILNRPDLRWIVVGEIHGTNETPEIFSDLVCLSSKREPVTVAVEEPSIEQPAIDSFISSNGNSLAVKRFLESGIWTKSFNDGRSSVAYFRLFENLRRLRESGHIISVIAFQPNYSPKSGVFNAGDYENALASSLISRTKEIGRVLVLVGNAHALRTSPTWAKPPYLPMAGYLPAKNSITLDARWNAGSYWTCGSDPECGVKVIRATAPPLARGIVLNSTTGAYDGALNIGINVSASTPKLKYSPNRP